MHKLVQSKEAKRSGAMQVGREWENLEIWGQAGNPEA